VSKDLKSLSRKEYLDAREIVVAFEDAKKLRFHEQAKTDMLGKYFYTETIGDTLSRGAVYVFVTHVNETTPSGISVHRKGDGTLTIDPYGRINWNAHFEEITKEQFQTGVGILIHEVRQVVREKTEHPNLTSGTMYRGNV
jgi:hypothetical protein